MEELKEIQELNRELFDIFELLFKEAFGMSPERFSSIDNFGSSIRSSAHKRVKNIEKAIVKYEPQLRNFYSNKAGGLFKLIKKSGGLKYVLGGGSHFLPTQFRAVKSMALYGDTILVPDPVFPWLEIERSEERFRNVKFLEQIFMILHLKPLIDAKLPYPAISIFPSWEKSLEKYDFTTREGIEMLVTNFFSFYLQIPFTDYQETINYTKKHPDDFLKQVDVKNLFIAPEHEKESVYAAVKHYREYVNVWRSGDYKETCNNLSDAELVWLGINERLAPQFHSWENSNELKAHPLYCVEAQWYYQQLTSRMLSGIVDNISPKSLNPIDSYIKLSNKPFEWLGNLSIEELVKLREDNENEEFREEIRKALEHLNSSEISDANEVAVEVYKVISNLIYKHQRKIKEINNRYFKKYAKTITAAIPGIAVSFLPILAPFTIAATSIAAGSTLIWDISEHIGSLKKESKSLMGVFSKYSNIG